MKVFRSMAEWQSFRDGLQAQPVGFVPTMGALHQGHLSLMSASQKDNAFTVVSVFVNPQQFDGQSDYDTYPIDMESDMNRLETQGVEAVLLPDATQMYADQYRFKVIEDDFSQQLCGAHRAGHFDGVLTIVMRLLNLVRPDNAYFGEKDFQQLQLIRDMCAAFFMPVNIVTGATIREADGLAMSSRNQKLNAGDRIKAAQLYAAIQSGRSAIETKAYLSGQGFAVDYVEDIEGRRFVAASLGDVRLIDNVEI